MSEPKMPISAPAATCENEKQPFQGEDESPTPAPSSFQDEKQLQGGEESLAPLERWRCAHTMVYFKKGHTLAMHFDFLAKRIGLTSPLDDATIADRLRLMKEKKIAYEADVCEPMLTDVRRDPGVEEVIEACVMTIDRMMSRIRHPEAKPFPRRGHATDDWIVIFKDDSYKLKNHFKAIGKSFDVRNENRLLCSYTYPLTEDERYLVLSDVSVSSVAQIVDCPVIWT